MKISWRKSSLWIVAGAVAIFFLIQPTAQVNTSFTYEIETISNTCGFDEFPEQDIRAGDNSILITLPIQTPTPCYDVEGTVTQTGSDITVNLETVKVGEVCVECTGIVVGKVTISNLEKGNYGLQVNSPDKALITTIMVE